MPDLNELFNEHEAQCEAEYKARVESGQEAKDIERERIKREQESERLERNGCIEDENEVRTCWLCGEPLDDQNTADDGETCLDCEDLT